MIRHADIPSASFKPEPELVLVQPRALPKGEVVENGLILELEQNTSVVDRPTLGKILKVGSGIINGYVGKYCIWVEQDGIDMELQDGRFLVLKIKSIIGLIDEPSS